MVVAQEKSPTTFQCQSSGIPSPTINWYRNGAVLSSSTDSRISLGVPNQQLQITGVYKVIRNITINSTEIFDAGFYSCVGENIYGNSSSVFNVTVQCESWITKPSIYLCQLICFFTDISKMDLFPSVSSVIEHNPMTFTATVTANPTPNVTWYFNDVQLLPTTSGIQITQTQQEDQIISKLMLASVTRVNAGQYTCKATNLVGSVSNTTTLPVRCELIMT